ncbi:hypothetical protein Zmor_026173 [Zophobas morio]|uniref:Uncharacterized protein n=1 Tax=Zophobas morio TaxID=2755281 RepID=A0AA38M4W5_9CUCU|nr:hypothetical protein Zmor_026173 [Zophobas morio]
MQHLLKVLYVFAILATFKCEDDEKSFGGYDSKNFHFLVRHHTSYTLQMYNIPILKEGAISDIPDMEILKLDEVHIQKIEPGAFQNLPKLQSMSIRLNNLSRIEAGVFNNLNISWLEISLNKSPLTIDADAFDNMTNLYTLILCRIKLTTWNPHWFFNTPNLNSVLVYQNLLEEIPEDAFQNLNSKNVLKLNLCQNRIKKVHDNAFRGVKKISLLSLQDNKLEEFNGNILKNISILEFRISENKFQCLNESDFAGIFVADQTAIGDNPWKPECLQKILKWGNKNRKTIQNVQYIYVL